MLLCRGRRSKQRVGRWGREEEASCVEAPPEPRESQHCTSTITHQHPNNVISRVPYNFGLAIPQVYQPNLHKKCWPLIRFQEGDKRSSDGQWEKGVSNQTKRLGIGYLQNNIMVVGE